MGGVSDAAEWSFDYSAVGANNVCVPITRLQTEIVWNH